MISIGVEKLINNIPEWLQGKKLALLCNQASIDNNFIHTRDLINKFLPGQLTCIFSPQHGFYAEKQDNMVESDHDVDINGVKIYSLYGDLRKPDKSMFDHFDVLLVDLVDVGTRVYTFMSTLAYCLETAATLHKKVVILDRPNPLGGEIIEGNTLKDNCKSFVGLFPLPMRHGLTFGELALYFNEKISKPADLEVISMDGWRRDMFFPDTGRQWLFPSPNLPGFNSALVYPGQVIWEGTNISEGRGTTLPFELFGAPFIDTALLLKNLEFYPEGCLLRPLSFEPVSNKWANTVCHGFHIHVTKPYIFKPYITTLLLLKTIMEMYPDQFKLKEPPYEYEYKRLPIDLILGDTAIYQQLSEGKSLIEVQSLWQEELAHYKYERNSFLLY